MNKLPDFDTLFDSAPSYKDAERARREKQPEKVKAPDFDSLFDAAPTVEESRIAAARAESEFAQPDAFGIAPTMSPLDMGLGLAAGGVDLSKALPQMIAGGIGEFVELPGNLQQDPSRVGEFYKRTMEAFPLEWEKWGLLTPEGQRMREATSLPFALPGMVGEEITPTILEHAGPEAAAAVQTGLELLPIIGMVGGAARSLRGGVKAGAKGVVEGLPEKWIFKDAKTGRSWTAEQVKDILRTTDETTLDPDMVEAFKRLPRLDKLAAIKGAGIDLTTVEPTWLGKLLGVEKPTAKPGIGKPPRPGEEPPPPAEPTPEKPPPDKPMGPAPTEPEIIPEPTPEPTIPPDAKVDTATFGSEVAANAAIKAYEANGFRTEVTQEGSKWTVRRWKPAAEDVIAEIERAPEVGAAPPSTVPEGPVSVAPPVPPQVPTVPPPPPSYPEVDRREKPYEGPRERRRDLETRKRIEDLTPEEKDRALRYDDLTGLKSRRAWSEAREEDGPITTVMDVHGQKWANDNLGHGFGDLMLQAVADAIFDAHGDGYRISGDEFGIKGQYPDQNEHSVQKIKDMLAEAEIEAELPDGTKRRFKGISISVGTGRTEDEAWEELNRDKEAAIARGERSAERGGRPGKLAEIPAAGVEAPGDKPPAVPEAEVDAELDFSLRELLKDLGLTGKHISEDELALNLDLSKEEAAKLWDHGVKEKLIDPEPPGWDDVREDEGPPEPEVSDDVVRDFLEEVSVDKEDVAGVPSEVRKGEEPVEAKPDEEASGTPPVPSGILQEGKRPAEGKKGPPKKTGEVDREEEAKLEDVPVSAPPEKQPHFVSGLSRPADFDAGVAAGADIGVELQELTRPMMKKVGEATATNKVFVDNGAFNAFKRQLNAVKAGAKPEIIKGFALNWSKTVQKYKDLLDLTVNPKNITFVAPDVIGDPEETHKKQNHYKGDFLDFKEAGVNVVWPLQRGGDLHDETSGEWDFSTTLDYHKNWFDGLLRAYGRTVVGTLPDGTPSYNYPKSPEQAENVIVGIPANAKAWSPEEVGRLVKGLGIKRVHLLGIGPTNKNYDAYVSAAKEADPEIQITTDASPPGLRRPDLEGARDTFTGISDDTMIYLNILGSPALSEQGAELLADLLGVEQLGLDRREFVNDVFNGDVFEEMTDGGKYEVLVDIPLLDLELAKVVRAENPAKNFRSEAIYQEIKRLTKDIKEPPGELPQEADIQIGKIEGDKILLDVINMAEDFAIKMKDETMPKDRTALKRYLSGKLGIKPKDLDSALANQKADWKNVEEAVEYAVIKVAKEVAQDENLTGEQKWEKILKIHDQQPLLSQRTSESIGLQQYSTPLPLAYLMGRWVNADDAMEIYEPTAGTGMLLVTANPDARVVANELDERRADILARQDYETYKMDATGDILDELDIREKADSVLMNPPFGSLGKVIEVEGYRVRQRDHEIAMRALRAMRPEGRAAILLGSHNLQEGHIRESDQPFINHVYNTYNVVGNIEIDGKVYRKQGTTWPVRVILINGRKPVPEDKMVNPPDLKRFPHPALYFDDVKRQMEDSYGGREGLLGGKGGDLAEAKKPGGKAPRPPRTDRPERDPAPTGEQQRPDGSGVDISGVRPDNLTSERPSGVDKRPRPGGKEGSDVSGDRGGDERPRRPDVEIVTGEHQTTYVPRSRGEAGGNKIPKRMADAVTRALDAVEKQVGDIDEFVAKNLEWSVDHLHLVFSAEQIDALALGFVQIDRGMGIIIGDQTGVGKGRVAAAMIRYANLQGKIPLFVTAMPKLFSDMWRDLMDIGHDVKPFLMHSDKDKASIYDEDGEVKFKPHGGSKVYKEMLGHAGGPEGYLKERGFGVVMLPYSQVQSPTSTGQREVITQLAAGNYAILDESHRASGNSRIGEFFRQAVVGAAKGVMYLSATYAKRPDTMSVYYRTNIGATGMSVDQLTDAITAGGTALQSWMANALAESGQMIRRELDFTGISFDVKTDFANKDRDARRVDKTTHLLRNILSFDRMKLAWIDELDRLEKDKEKMELGGGRLSGGKQTLQSGVSSTNFAATVHNAVNQLLLGVKADLAAEEAITQLRQGKKVVLNLMNTMQSFLDDLARQEGVKEGEPIDFGFNAVLKRALRNTLNLTITNTKGHKTKRRLTPDQLPPHLKAIYDRVMGMIEAESELDMPGSPIDYMMDKIRRAGFKVGEITGRSSMIDFSKEIPTFERRPAKEISDRNTPVIKFQKGQLDVLIINAAGSTGLSLHAGPKSDKKQRVMIVLQPDLNIDTFTQALGRINRKGQVSTPSYVLLQSAIPAEMRPGIVLRKKMSSLNANTTANTESGTSIDMPDMLNEYGDEVVMDFLADNSAINELLGDPMGVAEGGRERADAFRKVTGKVALAPVAIQERFYNAITEMFLDKIEYLDQIGENNLHQKDYDLQAIPKKRVKISTGKDESNPLTGSTYGDEMSVRVLKKPFHSLKVKELVDKALEGRDPRKVSLDIYKELERRYNLAVKEVESEYEGEDLARIKNRLMSFISRQNDVFNQEDRYAGNKWSDARHWRIGDTFKIGIAEGFDIRGVLIGIKLPSLESAGLPIAPSRIKLKFAVNSSLQVIDIPFSSEVAFRTSKKMNGIDPKWDENLLTADREIRTILTGNLLEGFGKIPGGKGQLINFTDSKGRRHDGILLPQGKTLTDLGQAIIGWEQAYEKFVAAHAEGKDSRMRSSGEESDQVRLSWDHDRKWPMLIVPLPKNRGQKYWGDPELVELTAEKRFDKSTSYSPWIRNRMVASVSSENVKKALELLSRKHGVRWTEPAKIEEVEDGEMADGPGGETTLYSTPLDPALIRSTFRGLAKAVQDLRETRQLAKKAKRTDLNWFNNAINTPYYVFAEKFPKYGPVFERARQGFQERDDISAELAQRGMDYFNLEFDEKEKVNKILIKGRFERTVFSNADLEVYGLTPRQIRAYRALRDMFDHALDIYEDGIVYRVTKGQVQSSSGLDLEVIAEVLKAIDFNETKTAKIIELLDKIRTAKRRGYAPFSRFGDYGYGLVHMKPDGKQGEIYYWATEDTAMSAAKAYRKLIKRFEVGIAEGRLKPIPPTELKQADKKSLISGIGGFELEMLSRFLELDPDTTDELKKAVEQLFQAHGFRKHFFESKDTPGFTTDMERATADYIIGLSGFVSRIKMIPEMDALAKGMKSTPKLAMYYKAWKDYITSPHEEYHRLRSGLFLYFLGGNPKSAAINLTQTLAATVPWLSQYVSMARAMKEVTAAARILINALGEKEDGTMGVVIEKLPKDLREIIRRGVREGIISEQLVYELMGVAKKPGAIRKLSKQKQRVVRGFGFMFQITEKINRFIAMIAAAKIHQSLMQKQAAEGAGGGAAPPIKPPGGGPPAATSGPFEQDPFEFSKRAVDETQFIYAKFNRPRAFRNFGAIFGVFRTFVVNILELYARFLRRKSVRAMLSAFIMLWFLSGIKGIPFAEDLTWMLEQIVGTFTHRTPDLETEVREWAYDQFGSPLFADYLLSGPNRNITGIDIGRSVGVGDVVPILGPDWEDPLAGIIGAPAEVLIKRPKRAYDFAMEGDYYRAVESVAPEFVRNPMYAFRILREGYLDRTGAPIIKKEDVKPQDVAKKTLGFTPTSVAKAQEREEARYRIGERTEKVKKDITREALRHANKGEFSKAMEVITKRAHGFRDATNRDNIIFTGRPLPKDASDWIILDEYTLTKQLEESKLGPKWRGILRQPTLQRPAYLKMDKLYQ